MGHYDGTFEWLEFPEGRAQFSGLERGSDERGHEIFAVEIDGRVTYGEVTRIFLPNDNDFNLQVVSYGYGMRESIGILDDGTPEPQAQGSFAPTHLQRVQTLVVRLVRAALQFENRPLALHEYPHAHFQGKVIFPARWAVGADAAEFSV